MPQLKCQKGSQGKLPGGRGTELRNTRINQLVKRYCRMWTQHVQEPGGEESKMKVQERIEVVPEHRSHSEELPKTPRGGPEMHCCKDWVWCLDFILRAIWSHREVIERTVTWSDLALERSLQPQCGRWIGGGKREGGGETKWGCCGWDGDANSGE